MKTIFAESVEGRRAAGYAVPVDENAPKAADMLPAELLRKNPPRLPQPLRVQTGTARPP